MDPGSILTSFLQVIALTFIVGSADAAPGWGNINRTFIIAESTVEGSLLGVYNGEPKSGGNLILTYQPLYINATGTLGTPTFRLYTAARFDYERETTIKIQGFLSEGVEQAIRDAYIIITDDNDNPPEFLNTPYVTTISENLEVGSDVFKVTATDADAKDVIEYKIVSGNEGGKFHINETTGKITLRRNVDYEIEKVIQLGIEATDNYLYKSYPNGNVRLSSRQVLVINVADEQDQPPAFNRLPYRASIEEELPEGTRVLSVSAEDGDRGVPRNITYFFLADDGRISNTSEDGYFFINEYTGLIIIHKKIDRDIPAVKDIGGIFVLNVQAREVVEPGSQFNEDMDAAEAVVTITIIDLDDNAPTFNSASITASVDENTQRNLPITFDGELQVSDPDNLDNGVFELILTKNGVPYSDLYVKPNRSQTETPVLVYVANSSAFDYEKVKTVIFEITARSITTPIKSNIVTVTLSVKDINDNPPKFEKNYYEASVAENSTLGTYIARVHATDEDSDINGLITYSLQGGSGRFFIDHVNGSISVNCECLDREKVDSYFLTVVATDGGKLAGVASMNINITDKNDETPKFQRQSYTAYLKENSRIFQEPVRVEASDGDEPGTNNSEIRYSLSGYYSGNFSVNETTGLVEVRFPLDIEMFSRDNQPVIIDILVTAADLGIPQLSSQVTLKIFLEDVNDMRPYFTDLPGSISVFENTTIGTQIFEVTTEDKDFSEPNNQVNYRIESGASERFQINMVTGQVIVMGQLDRELQLNYNLTISATDRGTPSYNSISFLSVELLDVNDVPPTMSKRVYDFRVSENASAGFAVGRVEASDLDLNAQLIYSILPATRVGYDADGKLIPGFNQALFEINETSGEIKVNVSLDRETVSRVSFKVEVEDVNAYEKRRQTDTGDVNIEIEDIIDTPPEFYPNHFTTIAVREENAKTFLKLQDFVKVYDIVKDLTFGIQGDFRVKGKISGAPPFNVQPTGDVETTRPFAQDDTGIIEFQVFAKNPAGLNGTATVEVVIVSSIHTVRLTFNKPEQQIKNLRETIINMFSVYGNVDVSIASIEPDPVKTDSTVITVYSLNNATKEPMAATELRQRILNTPSLSAALSTIGAQALESQIEAAPVKTDFYIAVGVCAFLAVILVAVVAGLLHLQRKLKWKLRAAYAATESSMKKKMEAAAMPNTNTFSNGNPLFQKNDQLEVLATNNEGRPVGNSEYSAKREQDSSLDLLGDDSKQAKPIDHQAVLQALMTQRQSVAPFVEKAKGLPGTDGKQNGHASQQQPNGTVGPHDAENFAYDTTEI